MRNVGIGAWGDDIRALQEMLNLWGFPVTVNGIFGNETRNAVMQFQENNYDESGAPLIVDGIVSPRTWKALARVVKR